QRAHRPSRAVVEDGQRKADRHAEDHAHECQLEAQDEAGAQLAEILPDEVEVEVIFHPGFAPLSQLRRLAPAALSPPSRAEKDLRLHRPRQKGGKPGTWRGGFSPKNSSKAAV